ncbi:MAG: PRC-barrel domain-containing protein [Cyclobacteriaceae bacterium]|nr:PRC-barrel domain-containing protein [Cyclobacteriaceae bacterium]
MKKLIILLIAILAATLFSGQSLADETKAEKSVYTAEQLIGRNVNNLEGKHVGIIRDVNLNSETGEINYVILGKSLLGIGEEKFVVPLEALKIQNAQGSRNAILIVEEDKLISASSTTAIETKTEKSVYIAEQLIGLNVNNLEGKHVGIIRDVNLNSGTGKINFVILGKSLLGIGEDKFAVPLEALKIQNAEESVNATLIVSEFMVITAPSIDAGESDEEFRGNLLNHYCGAPEFDEGMSVPKIC